MALSLLKVNTCVQDELRPILLRRMKEDVEDLPQKEEIVVRVQLTQQQRSFYKAIFAKQARSCCSPPSPTCSSPAVQHLLSIANDERISNHHFELGKSERGTTFPSSHLGPGQIGRSWCWKIRMPDVGHDARRLERSLAACHPRTSRRCRTWPWSCAKSAATRSVHVSCPLMTCNCTRCLAGI